LIYKETDLYHGASNECKSSKKSPSTTAQCITGVCGDQGGSNNTSNDVTLNTVSNISTPGKKGVRVTSISLKDMRSTAYVGETIELTAKIEPDNAENKLVSWSSSNTNIITLTGDHFTAVGVGTATIKITSLDDKRVTASCNVSVKALSERQIIRLIYPTWAQDALDKSEYDEYNWTELKNLSSLE